MDSAQNACVAGAEHARGLVQTAGQARIAGLDRLQRHRREAHQIGIDQTQRGAGQQRADLAVGPALLRPARGQQQADGDHRARHRVAQRDHAHARAQQRMRAQPAREGQQQRHAGSGQRGQAGQAQARPGPLAEALPRQAELAVQRLQRHQAQQQRHRQQEAQHHRQQAGRQRRPGRGALQLHRAGLRAAARPPGGREAQPRLRAPLHPHQHAHHQQQHGGELRCGMAVAEGQPGLVDAGGEGVQAEIGADAIVGQRLHQRQRHAGGQRGPCHRQRHLGQPPPRAGAEQPRGLHQHRAALGQRGARQQVDIRVERQDEQHDRAAGAADVGPERAGGAGARAQPDLQRAAGLQRVGVDIGQHIGGHRQRQQQRPLHHPAAGKAQQRHQRRRAAAHHRHAQRHRQRQLQRGQRIARQHGVELMGQRLAGGGVEAQPGRGDRQHRQRQHQAQQREQPLQRVGRLGAQAGERGRGHGRASGKSLS